MTFKSQILKSIACDAFIAGACIIGVVLHSASIKTAILTYVIGSIGCDLALLLDYKYNREE